MAACNGDKKPPQKKPVDGGPKPAAPAVQVPAFNADSAYSYLEQQLAFGPRTPGSVGHRQCGDWMVAELKAAGATVIEQTAEVNGWDLDGKPIILPMRNIIASFQPNKNRRVLFSAHWDTRPYADAGPADSARQAIPGANDGGSGVAVLLEMARHIGQNPTAAGVDLIFWDVEDHGNPEIDNSYCLGSQYWGQNLHKPAYQAMFGVNLDMVGAQKATFLPDAYSVQYAKPIVDKVWNQARVLGYGNHFIPTPTGAITDDHVYVIALTGIPMVDVIDMRPNTGRTFFGQWHTHQDDIHIIDRATLKAVGETMMHVLYEVR